MTATIAYQPCFTTLGRGYYGAWRFSDARSAQCATSDRGTTGGMNMMCPTTRCLSVSRS